LRCRLGHVDIEAYDLARIIDEPHGRERRVKPKYELARVEDLLQRSILFGSLSLQIACRQ
jgi:hypothetical protein